MSTRERVYIITVINFSKRNNGHNPSFALFDGNRKVVNTADRTKPVPARTLTGRFKNPEQAKRFGQRFGTVVSCRKYDTTPYISKRESAILKQQKPLTFKIDRQEYIIGKDIEIEK